MLEDRWTEMPLIRSASLQDLTATIQDLRQTTCFTKHAYAVIRSLSDVRILFDKIEISTCLAGGSLHLMSMDMHSLLVLITFEVASFAAAATGVIFKPGDWYKQLDKPRWRPPDWLFAPVWIVLYVAIGLSGWLVWLKAGIAGAALPLSIYAVQLLLNAAWTPIFFGLHRTGLAMVEIMVLWAAILATIIVFRPVSAAAALLLVPYLAWVSFAAALNLSILQRNRQKTRSQGAR